ncbi:hypothetical protein T439DRAFT_379788 [Meredithblackwellia eburnea MCA 4105]
MTSTVRQGWLLARLYAQAQPPTHPRLNYLFLSPATPWISSQRRWASTEPQNLGDPVPPQPDQEVGEETNWELMPGKGRREKYLQRSKMQGWPSPPEKILQSKEWKQHPDYFPASEKARVRRQGDYTQLALIGERVFDMHVTELLVEQQPDFDVALLKKSMEIIKDVWVPDVSTTMGLHLHLLAGSAQQSAKKSRIPTVRSKLLYSLIGAMYRGIDRSLRSTSAEGRSFQRDTARMFVNDLFRNIVQVVTLHTRQEVKAINSRNPALTKLQDYAKKYKLTLEEEYEHESRPVSPSDASKSRQWHLCRMSMKGKETFGSGKSKKEARREAAERLVYEFPDLLNDEEQAAA